MDTAWEARFIRLAKHVSEWSKDPSTQTGCVIVRPDRSVASVGYNGFPRGVEDTYERLNDRAIKYPMVVHAELNAILAAGESVTGCTAFVYPWPPCADCAGAVIQSGIERVVTMEPTVEQCERWGDSFDIMTRMFEEAGVGFSTGRWRVDP